MRASQLLPVALLALAPPVSVHARSMDVDEWPSTEVRPALLLLLLLVSLVFCILMSFPSVLSLAC